MFSKSLSTALLRKMGERDMTQAELAEACHLSKRFVGDVVRGNAIPTLDSFEKICEGLEVTPDDLLIDEKSRHADKASAMRVTKVLCFDRGDHCDAFAVCPSCNTTLEREYQNYCDRCGQKLSWKQYSRANVIYK